MEILRKGNETVKNGYSVVAAELDFCACCIYVMGFCTTGAD